MVKSFSCNFAKEFLIFCFGNTKEKEERTAHVVMHKIFVSHTFFCIRNLLNEKEEILEAKSCRTLGDTQETKRNLWLNLIFSGQVVSRLFSKTIYRLLRAATNSIHSKPHWNLIRIQNSFRLFVCLHRKYKCIKYWLDFDVLSSVELMRWEGKWTQ